MKTLLILTVEDEPWIIVEDEPWIASDLEIMVTDIITATVVVEPSIAATKKVLHEALDFAFLDVDVTNGKTFEVHRFSNVRMCLLLLYRARRKTSCLPTCVACPSFQSLLTRLKLSTQAVVG